MSIYKRNLKKLALGGASLNMLGQAGQTAESIAPATYKTYDQDYLNSNPEANKMNQNNIMLQQTQGKVENLAMKSGNPYVMAAGAVAKGSRLLSNEVTKGTTDKFGVVNNGNMTAKVLGDQLNPIEGLSHSFKNLGNKDLSTGDKLLGFTPLNALTNNKVATQQRTKYLNTLGNTFTKQGENNYNQALAEGFTPYGTQKESYAKGGKMSPENGSVNNAFVMMADGGQLKDISSENQEVEGRSHEQGGVKFPGQGVELEGGETVNKDFVFSKELGFAQQHKPIAKAIGKIEKKGNPNNRFDKNSIARLKEREEALKGEQEQTKQQLGIPSDLDMKKFGGSVGGAVSTTIQNIKKKEDAELPVNKNLREATGNWTKTRTSKDKDIMVEAARNRADLLNKIGSTLNVKKYGGGGNTIYKKISKVDNGDGKPGTSIYTPELAHTTDSRYSKQTPEQQAATQKALEGSNDPFQVALRNAQANKQDQFMYQDKRGNLPYKAGTTTTTPAINPTQSEVEQHRIITQRRDVKDITKDPNYYKSPTDRNAYIASLKAKGYQNIGGSYNYELPEKSEFMDANKVDAYFASNPNSYYADPKMHELQAKKKATTPQVAGSTPEFKMGGSINNKLKKYDLGGPFKKSNNLDLLGSNNKTSSVGAGTSDSFDTTNNQGNQSNFNMPNVSGYADNITNFILNRQRAKQQVPNQALTKSLNPVNFDLSAQKVEADRQRLGFNKGIDQNNSNVGTANTNKAIGLAQTIRAKNEINQNETNMNQAEKARVQGINSGIQTSNNAIDVNNRLRKLGAQDDIRREDSQNMANVVGKQQLAMRDSKQNQLAQDQNILNIGAQDIKTSYPFLKSNPDLAKRYGINLDEMEKRYNESIATERQRNIPTFREDQLRPDRTLKNGGLLYKKVRGY